jgi:hypothetical protein
MTRATYMRRDGTRVLWGVVIALALFAGLWYAGTLTLRAAREDERRIVLAEGDSLQRLATARGDTLRRALDSLRRAVRKVDTVLVARIVQAKRDAQAPVPPATDTAALVTAVRRCRATLDTLATECEHFRATATAALTAADSLRRVQDESAKAYALITAGITRSRDAALAQLTSRGKVRAFERGVCLASLTANYFQWRSR